MSTRSRVYLYSSLAIAALAIFSFVVTDLGYRALRKAYETVLYWPPEKQLDCKAVSPSPVRRYTQQDALVDGKLYVFGGFSDVHLHVMSRSDVYDPATDTWSQVADLPIAVTHAAFAVDGQTVWMAGGFIGAHPGIMSSQVWRYDTAADSWTRGPSLPDVRGGGGLVTVGRYLHYMGGIGEDRQTDHVDHWRLPLDAPSQWEPVAPMPVALNQFAAVNFEGQIYTLGGSHGHDLSSVDVTDARRYDPDTDSWSEIAPLTRPRSHFEPATFVADGKIVIVGGRSNEYHMLYEISAYDPVSDTWRDLGNLPQARRSPAARIINGRLYAGTGASTPGIFTPTANMISCDPTELGLMIPPRPVHASVR